MARTAIISDIHANYHALSAVIEDVHAMGCTDLVCLGDIVGYNAYPSECLDLVRKMNCPVVKGNHDEEVVSPFNARMNNVAGRVVSWMKRGCVGFLACNTSVLCAPIPVLPSPLFIRPWIIRRCGTTS